jgi:hypothetical protein
LAGLDFPGGHYGWRASCYHDPDLLLDLVGTGSSSLTPFLISTEEKRGKKKECPALHLEDEKNLSEAGFSLYEPHLLKRRMTSSSFMLSLEHVHNALVIPRQMLLE